MKMGSKGSVLEGSELLFLNFLLFFLGRPSVGKQPQDFLILAPVTARARKKISRRPLVCGPRTAGTCGRHPFLEQISLTIVKKLLFRAPRWVKVKFSKVNL
jgi:hypothetical protein